MSLQTHIDPATMPRLISDLDEARLLSPGTLRDPYDAGLHDLHRRMLRHMRQVRGR